MQTILVFYDTCNLLSVMLEWAPACDAVRLAFLILSYENPRNEKINYTCWPTIMSSMISLQCFEVHTERRLMTAETELMLMRLGTKASSVH